MRRFSSIAYKTSMALTGLFLCFFLVIHLLGNMFLFLPEPEAQHKLNAYAKFLTHLPPIEVAAYATYAAVVIHSLVAAVLTLKNRRSAGQRYEHGPSEATSPWYSRWMGVLGAILLLFLIVHMWDFWYPYKFSSDVGVDSAGNKDLYGIVTGTFSQLGSVMFYVVAMVALAVHLYRGIYNGLRSLGLHHPRYSLWARRFSKVTAIVLAIGFAAMPIYIYLSS